MYKDSMKPNPSLMDRGKHKAEAAFEAAKRE